MSSVSGTSLAVLKSFVASANAQYREAGLGEYQMRVGRDGSVTQPDHPKAAAFTSPAKGDAAGTTAPSSAQPTAATQQATAGAAAAAPGAAAASAAPTGAVKRSGPAPKISGLAQGGADAFKLSWAAVAGAKQYGIWQDGVLLGHVPSPSFAGQVAQGASSTIQVDAVLANGSRTALTTPLRVARGADGKLTFDAAGTAAPAATSGAG